MQIEEGKYYKDREGNVHGPMESTGFDETYCFTHDGESWTSRGMFLCDDSKSDFDLIEEVAGQLPEGGSSVSVKAPTCALGLLLDIQQAAHERGYEIEAFTYGEGNITLNMKEKAHA